MKINEVEKQIGINKKNIRFYENQGLLNPKRNLDNSYREYSDEDIEVLYKIKLLRKLGVSIEEIRSMLTNKQSIQSGIQRHLILLEKEKRNTEEAIKICEALQKEKGFIKDLNAKEFLDKMELIENTGTSFKDKQNGDVLVKYLTPIVITILVSILMTSLCMFMFWAYKVEPEEAPPIWFLWFFIGVCIFVIMGCIYALKQRIEEIGKGEIDEAKKY